jgi:hypothetical protein
MKSLLFISADVEDDRTVSVLLDGEESTLEFIVPQELEVREIISGTPASRGRHTGLMDEGIMWML